jgi:hypothetical protein
MPTLRQKPIKDTKNSLPVTVSFYATKNQALLLAELGESKIIHLGICRPVAVM